MTWLAVFIVTVLVDSAGGASEQELRVGVSAVDITPPVGYRMSGYFIERVGTAVHDPLYAKALVLAQGDTRAVLVVCDLVGVPADVSSRARTAIAAKTGIPVAHIAVTATHTHTGPLYFGAMRQSLHDLAVAKDGKDPRESIDYPATLAEKIAEAAVRAAASARPATLDAGSVRQEPTLSFNRRYLMKDGSVKTNPPQKPGLADIVRPVGPIDPDVGVVLVRDGDGDKVTAGLTVFAMHQDTTGGTEFSADFAYYLERSLREAFGPDFISIFGIGTCGDINHCDLSAERRRKAAEIGPMLAATVRAAVPKLRRVEAVELAVRSTTVDVPLQSYPADRVEQAKKDLPLIGKGQLPFLKEVEAYKIVDLRQRKGPTTPLEVQAIRISREVAIVTLPGEIFVEFGLAIKRASPFKTTLIIELANDNPAYIPTKQAFAEGGYETVNSRIAPGGGEMLTEAAIELLKSLGGN
ncbi:MAG: neutral/alkaline non-lysosomal ceramidase N-terminal domain-containing protein [Planctomycetes bacterium]|nr:neutral/alkaline non-lysosomal ceramidase N-terminal domain-containing protein [Planctomycetota bacterium]